jgi:hypothetical protein
MTCRLASRRQTSACWATPPDTRPTVRTPPTPVQLQPCALGGCNPTPCRLQPCAVGGCSPQQPCRRQPPYTGVGDDAESWAVDGVRKLKWYKGQARYSEY